MVHTLTVSRTDVVATAHLATDLPGQDPLSTRSEGAEVVLQSAEKLLLFCGPLLEPAVCATLQFGIKQALVCMCKGILPIGYGDSKMRRCRAEGIRFDPTSQILVLRLAVTEVFVCPANGELSSNVTFLRAAAGCCLSTSPGEVRVEAKRILTLLDSLLHPVAIALPPIPSQSLVRDRVAKRKADLVASLDGSGVEGVEEGEGGRYGIMKSGEDGWEFSREAGRDVPTPSYTPGRDEGGDDGGKVGGDTIRNGIETEGKALGETRVGSGNTQQSGSGEVNGTIPKEITASVAAPAPNRWEGLLNESGLILSYGENGVGGLRSEGGRVGSDAGLSDSNLSEDIPEIDVSAEVDDPDGHFK